MLDYLSKLRFLLFPLTQPSLNSGVSGQELGSRTRCSISLVLFFSFAILVVAFHLPSYIETFSTAPSSCSLAGGKDFIEYWAAYKVFSENKNLYDPAAILETQKTICTTDTPLMMWNPPWTLSILEPVLKLDFITSVRFFVLINIFLVFFASLLIGSSLNGFHWFWTFVIALSFPSVWNCLHYGQVGILLLFFSSLCYWALCKDKPLIAGVAMSFATIKPHLFITLGIFLSWWLIKNKQYRFFLGFFLALAAILLVTYLKAYTAILYYASIIFNPDEIQGIVRAHEWITASIPSVLGYYLPYKESSKATTIMLSGLVNIIVFSALVFYQPRSNLKQLFPIVLAISVVFSPFAWFFDQALLLPCFVLLVMRLVKLNVIVPVILLIFYLGFTYYFQYNKMYYLHEIFWFPLGLFAFWIIPYLARVGSGNFPPRVLD